MVKEILGTSDNIAMNLFISLVTDKYLLLTTITFITVSIFKKSFEKNPDFKLEYFQIADEDTLLPCLRKNKNKNYRAFIAVFVNNIRLIDTISLN